MRNLLYSEAVLYRPCDKLRKIRTSRRNNCRRYSCFGVSLHLHAIFAEKKRLIGGIISFLLLIGIIPALSIANTIIVAKEYQTFNQEIWNDPEYYNCRQYMIDDIKSKYGLVGMDVKEVKNILGENSYDSPKDNEFYYEIGQEFPGYKKFIITYDDNGNVTSAVVQE